MPRWLGLDYGHKRIGVAVGDTAGAVVSPVAVIPAEPSAGALARIADLAEQYHAAGIVVGWPLNMDDSEGPQAKACRAAAARLATACGLDVRLWDERLSSFQADTTLAGKLTRRKRKARQDAVAAAVMLEDFLARGGPDLAPRPSDPSD